MKTKKGVVTMTIRDGFKFGVGFLLGTSTITVLGKLIAKELSEKKPTNTEDDEKPEEVTE